MIKPLLIKPLFLKCCCFILLFFFLKKLNCVQGLAKQLAQVLLRGVCERSYEKPLNLLPSSPLISSTSSLKSGSKMDLKATSSNVITCKHATFPLKPQMYNGERYEMSLFVPFFKSFKLIWEFYWNSPNGEVWSKNQVILSLSFKSTPEIMTDC